MGVNSVGKLTAQMIVESEQAEASLKKISALAKLAKTDLGSIGGLFLANGDFKKFGDGIDDSTDKVKKHTAAMGEGEKALRGFYREQRLQDRTIRESKDALLGLTFGIMAVTSGMGEGSAKAKQFQMSLVGGIAAMQAGEFAAFGLGTAGKNLGGTMGNLASKLSQNAGMIGAIIGLGTGLYLFFRNTEDYAKKATEDGLQKFSDELDAIAGKMEDLLPKSDKLRRQVYQSELDIVTKELNDLRDKQKSFAEENKKIFEEGSLYGAPGKLVSSLKIKWGDIVNADELKEINEKMAPLITRQKELQALVAGQIVTADKPILTRDDQKRADEERKKTAAERLKLQEDLNKSIVPWDEAIKDQAAFEKSAYEAGGQTLDEYLEQLRALQNRAGIGEEYNALQIEINRAEKEHSDKIRQSAEESKRALDDKSEQLQMQYQLGKISSEKAIEELEVLRDSTADSTQRLKIEQKIVDIKNDQIQRTNEQLDQAVRIGSILEQAFSKSGDDLIAKLYQALQIAVQIAKLMQTKANGDGASALDWIESAASVIGFFANTETVSTGSGNSQAPQLNLSMGSASDNTMPNGLPYNPIRTSFPVKIPKGYLEQSVSSTSSTAGLMQEIRALRAEMAAKEFTIIIKNPITLGKGLETEMPKYEKYRKNKVIG